MESTESGPTDRLLDSVYLRGGGVQRRAQSSGDITASQLHGTQGSFHLSQVQTIKPITHVTHLKIILKHNFWKKFQLFMKLVYPL